MRRLTMAFVLAVAALTATATAASAVAANFASTSASVGSNGALTVSWDERGLGNGDIDYTLTADVSAVFACINGGGKHPQAANKETINSEVSASGTFESKNGRVQASLSSGAPSAGDFSCPGGQRLVLASVSYTNIVLTDTTNDSSVMVGDASRTFFAV